MYKKFDNELDSMNVDESGHLKTALDALRQLMIEKLNSDIRTRFAAVANLCEVAKSLMRAEAAPRVPKDVKQARYEDEDVEFANVVGDITFNGAAQYPDPGLQKRNRDVQMSILSQITIESQRSQLAAAEARELKDLLAVRDATRSPGSTEVLNTRIDRLLSSIKERNQDGDVVHSEFSRGSSTGSDKPNGDVSPHVQPVERGVEGDGSLQEESSEGRGDIQALGDT